MSNTYSDDTLWDYIDGRLEAGISSELRATIARDPDLELRIKQLKDLDVLLRKSMFRLAPVGLEEAVLAKLKKRKNPMPKTLLINDFETMLWVPVLLVICCIILIVYEISTKGSIDSPVLFLSISIAFTAFSLVAVDQILTYRKIKKRLSELSLSV